MNDKKTGGSPISAILVMIMLVVILTLNKDPIASTLISLLHFMN